MGPYQDRVVSPDVVRPFGSGPDARPIIEPQSWSHNLARLDCLPGTFSPSRLLWFTFQPPSCMRAVILRYQYLPKSLANRTLSSVRICSYSEPVDSYLWVDRGWPDTRHTLRSDTQKTSLTCSVHRRRRVGLRNFPQTPLSASGCPGSSRRSLA